MSISGLITGCGKGIGLACAHAFLSENEGNILLGISRTRTESICKLIDLYGARFTFAESDVTDYQTINKAIDSFSCQRRFPDFAICNAAARSRISIFEASLQTYRDIFEINTVSQISIVKHLLVARPNLNHLLHILMLSSIVGNRGFDELSTYGVSKLALEGFVKSAAIELASQNVLINSINPGFANSSYARDFKESRPQLYEWTLQRTPLKRWASCEEVANLALFLVSKKNTYMTGSVIYCDGGWSAQ